MSFLRKIGSFLHNYSSNRCKLIGSKSKSKVIDDEKLRDTNPNVYYHIAKSQKFHKKVYCFADDDPAAYVSLSFSFFFYYTKTGLPQTSEGSCTTSSSQQRFRCHVYKSRPSSTGLCWQLTLQTSGYLMIQPKALNHSFITPHFRLPYTHC